MNDFTLPLNCKVISSRKDELKISLDKVTIQNAAKSILEKVNMIGVNDLDKLIYCHITGKSLESVKGTTFRASTKIRSKEWFNEKYVFIPSKGKIPSMVVTKELANYINTQLLDKSLTVSYDSEEKMKARLFIFNNLEFLESPKIFTLAGDSGLDVKCINDISNNSIIHNVERDKVILNKYKEKGYNTIDFNMSFNKFFELYKDKEYYDIINLDTLGSLGRGLAESLEIINEYRLAGELNLTIDNKRKISNTGVFASTMKNKYKNHHDQVLRCIKDIMVNYKLIDEYNYIQNDRKLGMRILKFKLK